MSMLSSMCDNLRDRAHELRMFANGMGAPHIMQSTKESARITMLHAAAELLDAADTIDELRTRCQDLQFENSRLRELVDAWMGCGTRYHTMQGGCPMFDADAFDFCKAARLARELGIEVE